MPDSMVGKTVGEFVIKERLGQGAMASVYKAFEPSINRYVALKIIRLGEDYDHEGEFRLRFAREAEVIARLEHIHILPIYAYGIDDDVAYLAMRWLKGGSLSELLKRQRVSLEQAANIFRQIALGLAFAHSKGVIHRDLKPSNIMLDDEGNAYLTDFGLAKMAEASGDLTKSGNIVGTPAYMSPEQLRGEPLDHRSDIYSLGVILYNMLAGRLPFDTTSGDLVSIIYQHLEIPPTPPSEYNPHLSSTIDEVILRALQKDRINRFYTATDMSKALNIGIGLPQGSSDNLAPMPQNRSTTQQNLATIAPRDWRRVIIPMGIIAVVTLIAASGLFLFQTVNNSNLNSLQTATAQHILAATVTQAENKAIVLAGESEPSSKIVPDKDTIEKAQVALGKDGFIAFIACTQNTAYHAGLARDIADLVRKYGLNYRLYDSQVDAYREVTLVDNARAEGATALIICPLDMNLLNESLESAQKAGIPLVFQADHINSYGGVLVGGDPYLLGLTPGEFAGNLVQDEMDGKADVIILDFPDREDIVTRANGLEDGLKNYAPDAHIIGRFKGGTREFGKASVEQLLKDGIKFDVILSINDAGAFGAIEAMEEANIKPDAVRVISIDAEPLALEYIRKQYFMRGSVQSTREEMAWALVNSIVQLLAGNTIPETIMVPPGAMVSKETLELTETPTP
ncbi:MAG: protein kinase [Anaerolineae bacterium]